jgi:hypothetical protein
VSEAYQKAADRVANLAFTVVTASAAVIVLAPAVKVLAEYVTRLLPVAFWGLGDFGATSVGIPYCC